MTWGAPSVLMGLWLIPLIGYLILRAQQKRRRAAGQFVDRAMASRLMPAFGLQRTIVKATLLMTAMTCLILALARPRYGFSLEEVSSRGVDVMVLLDVSRSMLAEDVKPNRLQRAKSDIIDLLQRLEGDRVGLVVFAGAPVVQIPLTTDHSFYRIVLQDVDTTSAPRGGTMIGDAVRCAMQAMPPQAERDQAVVLITDGGDLDSFPIDAAEAAAARNLQIISVGLGDVSEGARIPSRSAEGGLGFVQYDGQEVWSKMDEGLLEQMATITSGAYIPAQTRTYDLGQIYDDQLSKLTQSEFRSEKRRRYHERYQWFAAAGLLLLLLDLLISPYASVPGDSVQREVVANRDVSARREQSEGVTR
ncbi:MAG: VWA domain-containing protein [Planctomycetaceae bacterium]|nr:VWA domain-containing protein [Planctomycetaceae bacterium]